MPLTENDLMGWLGAGWSLRKEVVPAGKWSDVAWRAEYLCKAARMRQHFLAEQAAPEGGQLLVFAVRSTS